MTGKLVVITGLPGAGKDTLMNMLLSERPDFKKIVTFTSRLKRPGETEGKDYHFITNQKFEEMVKKDLFFEYVKTGFHYKGTTKEEIKKILKGKNLIWRIDLSRAAILEDTFRERLEKYEAETLISKTTKILIKPPSIQASLERYQLRDKDKADLAEFQKRVKDEMAIYIKYRKNFPHVIVNETGKPEKALREILRIIGD